ncbi:MAG: type II secretion system F family protein [Lachnospiraceae bacterium]|nr:type II secretion system F family protein [Lachnospiraceae bacterium]
MMKTKKLNNQEVASFCSQLSLLLPAGITPFESIHLMAKDTESAEIKTILNDIEQNLMDGISFSEALELTHVFPDYVISMIDLGEESGNLDIIMLKLSQYYEQQCNISESIKNAISYPLIMISLMLFILIVLLSKILPIFEQVFGQLGSELTGVSNKLIKLGHGIQSISGILIIIFVILALCMLFFKFNAKANKWLLHKFYSIKITRNFCLSISYSRFAGALSLITAGGIDIYKGINLAQQLIDNDLMLAKIEKCKEILQKGDYLFEAIRDAEIFQAQHQRMLQIGFKTGDTDTVFEKISKYYEDYSISKIQKILGAIEPTLVIVFSMLVGLILMSVIMPLIGIMSSIG